MPRKDEKQQQTTYGTYGKGKPPKPKKGEGLAEWVERTLPTTGKDGKKKR